MVRKRMSQKDALAARREILGDELKVYWSERQADQENTPVNLLLDQLEQKASSNLPVETKNAIQEILAIHSRNQKHVDEIETILRDI